MIHLFHVPQMVPAERASVPSLSSCITFVLPPGHWLRHCPLSPFSILSPLGTLQGQACMLIQLDDYNSSILFLTKPPTSTTWTTAAIISLFKVFLQVPKSYLNSLAWHFSMPTPNSLLWHSGDLKLLFLSHSLPFPSHSISFQHGPSSWCIIKSQFPHEAFSWVFSFHTSMGCDLCLLSYVDFRSQ